MKHLLLTTIAAVVLVGCGSPMWVAARKGNITAVKQHLAAGVHVNAKNESGWTPLHQAVWGGHKETAELLIANGADVNIMTDGDRWTPLHEAARSGRKEIAELLINKGADVNAMNKYVETPLDIAIRYKNPKTADLLRTRGGKSGAADSIHVAAELGNIEAVKQHLAAGADVNAKDMRGRTPLYRAARNDQKETVTLLLGKGANVNIRSNSWGRTPLGVALRRGKEGLDFQKWVRQWGYTPLDVTRNDDVVNLLRKHGAKTAKELKAAGK
jgi:ankyrin